MKHKKLLAFALACCFLLLPLGNVAADTEGTATFAEKP